MSLQFWKETDPDVFSVYFDESNFKIEEIFPVRYQNPDDADFDANNSDYNFDGLTENEKAEVFPVGFRDPNDPQNDPYSIIKGCSRKVWTFNWELASEPNEILKSFTTLKEVLPPQATAMR